MSRLPALAVRNVGRNRRRSLLTVAMLVFGVAMVILVRGFTWGLHELLIADTVEGRLGALQVHRRGFVENIDTVPTGLNIPYSEELRARILSTPHVRAVSGRLVFNGLVSNGATQTMFVGRGLDVAHESDVCPRVSTVVLEGAALGKDDAAAALVGYELAQAFALSPGKLVNLQTQSPAGRANALDLTVRGLTASNLPFENQRVVTVPLATAQELLGLSGRVTEYAVAVDDLAYLDEVRRELSAKLGDEYEVHTWSELQPFVRDLINRQNFVLGIVTVVLFVIVLTGIINTMLMSVFERVREIGTLLAVGVRRRQVRTLFLLEALTIGVLGALAGALLGRALVAAVAFRGIQVELAGVSGVNVLRPHATWTFSAACVLVALLGALLAAAWPAWRASRLNPVDALRSS